MTQERQEFHRGRSCNEPPGSYSPGDGADPPGQREATGETGASISPGPEVERALRRPFEEYAVQVCAWHLEDYSNQCDGYHEPWRSPMWDVARWLRGHPSMLGRSAKQALAALERALHQENPDLSKDELWEEYLGISREEGVPDFLVCWERVRCPVGQTPLDVAAERARRCPLTIPDCCTEGYGQFISLAGWLQVGAGQQPIYLSCRTLGEYLGVTPMSVSRYRALALQDDLLLPVREAVFRSQGKSEATEFWFNLERFPQLRKHAAWAEPGWWEQIQQAVAAAREGRSG